MKAGGQTLCLSMIVKNEASVIGRCLPSLRPIIDYWVIVDTGCGLEASRAAVLRREGPLSACGLPNVQLLRISFCAISWRAAGTALPV